MTDILIEGGATPINLYLSLVAGQTADMEVAMRAGLAWAAAIREAAWFLDPSLEIRIGLESGTESSLSLNAIIEAIKDKIENPKTMAALVMVAAIWFGGEIATDAVHKEFDRLWDEYVGQTPQLVTLAPDQIKEISDRVAKTVEGRVAAPHVQQVYRELERDPAVSSVGVGPGGGQRPLRLVPRSEFAERAGRSEVLEYVAPNERTISTRMWVGLVRPWLSAHERHSWGFRAPTGNFNAAMKAKTAVDRLLTGQTPIPMVEGIEMEIELEVKERLENGAWVTKERSVTQIYDWRYPPTTGELFPAPH